LQPTGKPGETPRKNTESDKGKLTLMGCESYNTLDRTGKTSIEGKKKAEIGKRWLKREEGI
jgi:hypothetical protein